MCGDNCCGACGCFEEAVYENEAASSSKASDMTFGDALWALKRGKLVARSGWNGKGMFLYFVKSSTFNVNRAPLSEIFPMGTPMSYHGHIDMKTAQGDCVPWVASQTDLLAEDWVVVDPATVVV